MFLQVGEESCLLYAALLVLMQADYMCFIMYKSASTCTHFGSCPHTAPDTRSWSPGYPGFSSVHFCQVDNVG